MLKCLSILHQLKNNCSLSSIVKLIAVKLTASDAGGKEQLIFKRKEETCSSLGIRARKTMYLQLHFCIFADTFCSPSSADSLVFL